MNSYKFLVILPFETISLILPNKVKIISFKSGRSIETTCNAFNWPSWASLRISFILSDRLDPHWWINMIFSESVFGLFGGLKRVTSERKYDNAIFGISDIKLFKLSSNVKSNNEYWFLISSSDWSSLKSRPTIFDGIRRLNRYMSFGIWFIKLRRQNGDK